MWPFKLFMHNKLSSSTDNANTTTSNNSNNQAADGQLDHIQSRQPTISHPVSQTHNTPPTQQEANSVKQQHSQNQSVQGYVNDASNITTNILDNDHIMEDALADKKPAATATVNTPTTQRRHHVYTIDEAAGELNQLSPFKISVVHSPMEPSKLQPPEKKRMLLLTGSTHPSSNPNNHISDVMNSSNSSISNNNNNEEEWLASNPPQINRMQSPPQMFEVDNLPVKTEEGDADSKSIDISNITNRQLQNPHIIIKGEKKAPESPLKYNWEYGSWSGNTGTGRPRNSSQQQSASANNNNVNSNRNSSNVPTTPRRGSTTMQRAIATTAAVTAVATTGAFMPQPTAPHTPLHTLNPNLNLCMETNDLDADHFYYEGPELQDIDTTGIDNGNITGGDYLEVADAMNNDNDEPEYMNNSHTFNDADRGDNNNNMNANASSNNNNSVNIDGGISSDSWIPSHTNIHPADAIRIEDKYKGFILDRSQSVKCVQGRPIGIRSELNDEESKRVFGRNGILRGNCAIYNKKLPRFGNPMANGETVEDLQHFECAAEGCCVTLKLARVKGGLLLYKKENPNTPGQPYSHCNHNVQPPNRITEYALSVEQREEILKRWGPENMKHITHDMIQSDEITTFPAQNANPTKFKQVAQSWAGKKSTKNKYYTHDYQQQNFTTEETKQVLDTLLNSAVGQQWNDANEFMQSSLFKTMAEQIRVLEHNFSSEGGKDVIFFESNKIEEVVRLAGLMFPNDKDKKGAIQFSCDFTHIPGTNFVLGICGVDDFLHHFWPTSFIICPTENGESAKKIMGRMTELINADINGATDKALIDGAHALSSACVSLGVDPRSCFTHVVRLPLTRGGGKVGSKGSFANYLIQTMKVSHSDSAKIVGDTMLANYIPPKYESDFKSYIDLMRERHDDRLSTKHENNEAHKRHVYNSYLSHDPKRLGGRAVGIPGQGGSNNGGEARGGEIKNSWRSITKKCNKEAKKSPLFIVAAVAMDLMMLPNLTQDEYKPDKTNQFAFKPPKSEHDYDFLRRINKFNIESNPDGNLPSNAQYMMATNYGKHAEVIDFCKVIGNGSCSCTFQLPSCSRVLTSLRAMEQTEDNSADSWLENPVVDVHATLNSYQKCRNFLNQKMTKEKKKQLHNDLWHNLVTNTPGKKDGESFRSFVRRRLQRNPSDKTTNRTITRRAAKKARKVKVQTPLDVQREKDKHGVSSKRAGKKMGKTNKKIKGKNKKSKASKDGEEAGIEEYLYWTDEFDEEDILKFLNDHGFKDCDSDLWLKSIAEESTRVGPKRELGDWVEVDVDAERRVVTCNCEDFNFDGFCYHVATFELLQFGVMPGDGCENDTENWVEIRKKCIRVLKHAHLLEYRI